MMSHIGSRREDGGAPWPSSSRGRRAPPSAWSGRSRSSIAPPANSPRWPTGCSRCSMRAAPGEHHPFITVGTPARTPSNSSATCTRPSPATVADLQGQLDEVRAVIDELGDYDLICSGSHPFSQWYDQQLTDKPRYHKLIERTPLVGTQHDDLGRARARRHRGPRQGAADPRRTARLPAAPAGAERVEPVLGGRRDRLRLEPRAHVPAAARPRDSPTRSPTGRPTSATSTTSSAPASSRTTARCAGTSARRRSGAPSRCGSATACRPRPRSAPSARSCSASSSG